MLSERSVSAPPPASSSILLEETPSPTSTLPTAGPSLRRSSPDYLTQMSTVLMSIAAVVAARLLLLLALIGSFVLTFLAIWAESWTSLGATMSFDVLVVLPLAALAYAKG